MDAMSIFRCQFFPKAYQRERQSRSTQQQQSIWGGIDAMLLQYFASKTKIH
jgi:hypothetical protein